jgi:hypothetical protein
VLGLEIAGRCFECQPSIPTHMKNKKVWITVLLAITFAALCLIFYFKKDLSLTPYLKNSAISINGSNGFQVVNKEETKKDELTLELKNKREEHIKATFYSNLSEEAAKKSTEAQEFFLLNLYKASPPPYPELIGQSLDCDKKYVPIKKTIENGVYFTLLATSRFTYGVCADESGEYKAALGYLYCNNSKTLLKIEYFSPKDKDNFLGEKIMESLRCKK